MRRATVAAAPIERPIASAYITVISDSVMPDGRDGVGAEAADEEHVGDHEHRLHHHLEHHRHCEKDDGTPDGRFREVLM